MVRVTIDSRLRLEPSDLPEGFAEELRAAFTHKNPKRAALQKSGTRGWWNEPVAIPTWGEDEAGRLTLPRGAMSRLRELLREKGQEFVVYDRRAKFAPDDTVPEHRRVLRGYQVRLVEAAERVQNCLVRSGTGSGKTTALLALYSRLKVPTLVLVNQLGLAEQWEERCVEELGMRAKDVGLVGDGKLRLRHLTIATPKSASAAMAKDPAFAGRWGAVFADEVHLFAARSLFACVDRLPAQYRVGASDDERRKDRLEFLIYDLFGKPAAEVSDQELVESNAVFGVEVLVVPTDFEADWYATGDDEDKKPDFGLLVKEMAEDPARQEIIERILATELAEERQIIVFAKEREHCRSIGTMAAKRARTGYLIGGPDYRQEFKRTKAGMKAGEIRVGVGTYQSCGIALDVPTVEVGICATPCLSNRTTFRQGRGRVCRKPAGKTVARLYVLWDRKVFGLRHLENAARWNPSTFVWDGRSWVPVREYLRRERIAVKEAKDGEG